jgi:hypothetical protein
VDEVVSDLDARTRTREARRVGDVTDVKLEARRLKRVRL